MAELAIVAPIFISNQSAFTLATEAMKSVGAHLDVDRIAIVNHIGEGDKEKSWLHESFDLVHHNDQNILARAWNVGARLAFERGATYALIINLDIIFHRDCIQNLLMFAKHNPSAILW